MLTFPGRQQPSYDRRDFLRIGALGLGGLALSDVLRLRAQGKDKGRNKSVIMICLTGGPSQIDMYDLKPKAPAEFRGEFKPIRTNVSGFDVCELLPLQAQIADQLAVVRNMQFHDIQTHDQYEIYTGYPKLDQRPSFGSVISHLHRGAGGPMPRYVSLGTSHPWEHARYVGRAHQPLFHGDGLQGLGLPPDVNRERVTGRKHLLGALDGARRQLDGAAGSTGMDVFTAQALDMITSARVRDAFDLTKEPTKTRDRYGNADAKFTYLYADKRDAPWHADKLLLARRLVEAGVPVVTLSVGAWDHHGRLAGLTADAFSGLRSLLPLFDRSLHALVTDLHDRGLSDDVTVVVWGEFGRTPRITQYAGRDHWADAGFALFAGGGLRMGQVVGETDRRGNRPVGRSYRPQNVLATLYRLLGIDPACTLADSVGRPLVLLDDPQPIAELF